MKQIKERLGDSSRVGSSETDALLSDVVNVTELTNPGVSKDPGRSESPAVLSGHAKLALVVTIRHDIIVSLDGELVASDGENDVSASRAGNTVAAESVECGSNGVGDFVDDVARSDDERGACIGDHVPSLAAGVTSGGGGVHAELPVGGRGERHVFQVLGAAVGVIEASVGVETSASVGNVSLLLHPHGKDGLVKESLVDGVDEGRDDVVNSEALEAETQDAVKGGTSKERGDGGGLSEGGLGHAELIGVVISEANGVHSKESISGSGSVGNAPLLAVLLVSRRLGRVELVLASAGAGESGLLGAATARRITDNLAEGYNSQS
ncbi:hypothetical protein L596_022601 [Steinernema carpocapsae]|uniref:Uncharacterized protein n=1 Tax=Steinernema carpocapsae TaxID=34508 RepID=A0A4U5MM62_STECR|nr:hypothetical protein L596_022601 [Steinernema carpocapsae]